LPEARYRVLAIASHPVQYLPPLLRRLTQHPQLNLSVAYCSLRGAQRAYDPDFKTDVQWDIPLLDGYSWREVPNRGPADSSFLHLFNPGLWSLIRNGHFDAVLSYLSYRCASFWIAFSACRLSRTAFLFGTDASSMVPRDASAWKLRFKSAFWPHLYSWADQVLAPSTPTRELMLSLGIPAERVTLVPYSVDNSWWMDCSASVDRDAIRANWGAAPSTCVILFCGKLQPWKRPLDVLRAFAQARLSDAVLVYAGEGALRSRLEQEACCLAVSDRVRFLGFQNQSELPSVYTAADLMVLPSEYEPFAVVVNEAYCCGCAVIASDHVGAARDLILPVDQTLVYPCGNVQALSAILVELSGNPGRLRMLGDKGRERINTWSLTETAAGTVEAIRAAVGRRRTPVN
jgi:glycosyltransferase involved in cell wall biosynthesis